MGTAELKPDQPKAPSASALSNRRSRRKKPAIQLTARDVEILQFINQFGFCEMPQLDQRFGWCRPRNYQVMQRLVDAGLLHHERVFYGRHGIYRLTVKGAKHTSLPPLAKVPLANYQHDLALIGVYLRLRQAYPEAQWISERELMQAKHADGVGKRGHLPDGILAFPDGKQVAIEVELTLKSKVRLERILKGYGSAFEYQAVWYYCPPGVKAVISALAAKLPFINIYGLTDSIRMSRDDGQDGEGMQPLAE